MQDTLIERLLRLEGYVPVQYNADSAEYRSSDRTLRLRGRARVERESNVITAVDSIVYRDRSDFVAAYGSPQGNPSQGEPITGDIFFYDLAARRSTVLGARTKITESATWFVSGDVTDERGERIYASDSEFTSDDREDPAYHFKADRIMIIRNRILVGRPAYLYFKNVPVMALPFIVQDLERGRRSGILIPSFEINDIIRTNGRTGQRGTGREISNIGYYWAINQYLGAQLAGRWRSGSYSALAGDIDFNFRRRFLNGSIAFERFWQNEGPRRLTLNGGAQWKYDERTDISGTVSYASSSRFERDRVVDFERQTEDLSSNLSATRRFDWGQLALNAERRQSIANDDVVFTPRLSLGVNPFNILPSVVVNFSVNGQRTTNTPGDGLVRRLQETEQAQAGTALGLTIGDLTISTSAAYSNNSTERLRAIPRDSLELGVDTARGRELFGSGNERIQLTAGTSYQIPLFASTRVSPSISFSREMARLEDSRFPTGGETPLPDSLQGVYGEFVSGPARLNIGATLNTDLYGFFPGFGEYTTIRHHIQPLVSWRYSPAARESDTERRRIQERVFGRQELNTQNVIELTLNQTFEAKVRDPDPVTARPDSAAAGGVQQGDSASTGGGGLGQGNAARPSEPRKVTLLSINTSALSYSFEDLDTLGIRFRNEEISNSVRTDLLGGLTFTVSHDLFDDRLDESRRVRRGRLSPFLTSFNTSFSLGQNSAIFRWLGFSRRSEEERATERGQTPDSAGVRPQTPTGGATFTGNNQMAGGGPWNLSLNYSLSRNRRSVRDSIPGIFDRGNSTLGGTLTFAPTKNWGVSWTTQYSTTTGDFAAHSINLKRDLYRWQANFDYNLGPNGNTRFAFSVHLTDLPDLKADYNESNLGVDRADTGNQ
ncbi:MAG TPA: putative LPS assembly protein LptD, partial [Longimicrobium sp.]|nr:putative LPS assembly protein LptD [Longimicrobium sp.]